MSLCQIFVGKVIFFSTLLWYFVPYLRRRDLSRARLFIACFYCCRDASIGPSTYNLTVLDCLHGLSKVSLSRLFVTNMSFLWLEYNEKIIGSNWPPIGSMQMEWRYWTRFSKDLRYQKPESNLTGFEMIQATISSPFSPEVWVRLLWSGYLAQWVIFLFEILFSLYYNN